MVRGGGWPAGEKNKLGVGGRKKGERKKKKNYINKGGKDLKNACFWAINSKMFRGGVFRPSLPPPPCRRRLICREKINLKRGGGE